MEKAKYSRMYFAHIIGYFTNCDLAREHASVNCMLSSSSAKGVHRDAETDKRAYHLLCTHCQAGQALILEPGIRWPWSSLESQAGGKLVECWTLVATSRHTDVCPVLDAVREPSLLPSFTPPPEWNTASNTLTPSSTASNTKSQSRTSVKQLTKMAASVERQKRQMQLRREEQQKKRMYQSKLVPNLEGLLIGANGNDHEVVEGDEPIVAQPKIGPRAASEMRSTQEERPRSAQNQRKSSEGTVAGSRDRGSTWGYWGSYPLTTLHSWAEVTEFGRAFRLITSRKTFYDAQDGVSRLVKCAYLTCISKSKRLDVNSHKKQCAYGARVNVNQEQDRFEISERNCWHDAKCPYTNTDRSELLSHYPPAETRTDNGAKTEGQSTLKITKNFKSSANNQIVDLVSSHRRPGKTAIQQSKRKIAGQKTPLSKKKKRLDVNGLSSRGFYDYTPLTTVHSMGDVTALRLRLGVNIFTRGYYDEQDGDSPRRVKVLYLFCKSKWRDKLSRCSYAVHVNVNQAQDRFEVSERSNCWHRVECMHANIDRSEVLSDYPPAAVMVDTDGGVQDQSASSNRKKHPASVSSVMPINLVSDESANLNVSDISTKRSDADAETWNTKKGWIEWKEQNERITAGLLLTTRTLFPNRKTHRYVCEQCSGVEFVLESVQLFEDRRRELRYRCANAACNRLTAQPLRMKISVKELLRRISELPPSVCVSCNEDEFSVFYCDESAVTKYLCARCGHSRRSLMRGNAEISGHNQCSSTAVVGPSTSCTESTSLQLEIQPKIVEQTIAIVSTKEFTPLRQCSSCGSMTLTVCRCSNSHSRLSNGSAHQFRLDYRNRKRLNLQRTLLEKRGRCLVNWAKRGGVTSWKFVLPVSIERKLLKSIQNMTKAGLPPVSCDFLATFMNTIARTLNWKGPNMGPKLARSFLAKYNLDCLSFVVEI